MEKQGEVKAGVSPVEDGCEVCDAIVAGKPVKLAKTAAVREDGGTLKDVMDVHG